MRKHFLQPMVKKSVKRAGQYKLGESQEGYVSDHRQLNTVGARYMVERRLAPRPAHPRGPRMASTRPPHTRDPLPRDILAMYEGGGSAPHRFDMDEANLRGLYAAHKHKVQAQLLRACPDFQIQKLDEAKVALAQAQAELRTYALHLAGMSAKDSFPVMRAMTLERSGSGLHTPSQVVGSLQREVSSLEASLQHMYSGRAPSPARLAPAPLLGPHHALHRHAWATEPVTQIAEDEQSRLFREIQLSQSRAGCETEPG